MLQSDGIVLAAVAAKTESTSKTKDGSIISVKTTADATVLDTLNIEFGVALTDFPETVFDNFVVPVSIYECQIDTSDIVLPSYVDGEFSYDMDVET